MFVVFLLWLLVIVLGGLGLTPIAGIPLTHALRPSPGPPPVVKLPKPRQPSASDLRPAVPAKVYAATVAKKAAHGKSSTAPGQTKTTTTTTTTGSAHGKSTTAPGRTRTTTTPARGKSGTSHGHTTTTTTTVPTTTIHGKKP